MKENYRIYKKFGKDIIENNDILRIDLFNNYKIKDIKELKEFKFIYEQKGHKDFNREVRYIRVFKR